MSDSYTTHIWPRWVTRGGPKGVTWVTPPPLLVGAKNSCREVREAATDRRRAATLGPSGLTQRAPTPDARRRRVISLTDHPLHQNLDVKWVGSDMPKSMRAE